MNPFMPYVMTASCIFMHIHAFMITPKEMEPKQPFPLSSKRYNFTSSDSVMYSFMLCIFARLNFLEMYQHPRSNNPTSSGKRKK